MDHAHGFVATVALVGTALLFGRLGADPSSDGAAGGPIGPDIIVGAIPNVSKFGTVDGVTAYALGSTSCNIGDDILLWCDTNVAGLCSQNEHPVKAQNMYRLKDGRIEQIGMSWVSHGFCALSESLCGTCIPDQFGCNALGVGCSNPYDATLQGSQGNLGPRSQVNVTTGAFPYPFTAPPAPPMIGRRLQVGIDDLAPPLNIGALYFAEVQHVHFQDALVGNGNNNASYRRLKVGPIVTGGYTLGLADATFQQKPAIEAWKDHGLGLDTPDADVSIVPVDVSGDGRFVVACKASPVDADTWRYEYAVYNMNSDRCGGSFFVPVPPHAAVDIASIGQHIINHHSGEPYSAEPWTQRRIEGGIQWNTADWTPDDPNANALRWGTMFNFRFDTDAPPAAGEATLGLCKPGTPMSVQVVVVAPSTLSCPPTCSGDLDGNGVVDGVDLGILLGAWGTRGPVGDLDGSGKVDGGDLGMLLGQWS